MLRRHSLYPAELRARIFSIQYFGRWKRVEMQGMVPEMPRDGEKCAGWAMERAEFGGVWGVLAGVDVLMPGSGKMYLTY